jgi:hypothetical protein
MNRVIRAELMRLVRRRTIAITVGAAFAFAVVATLALFASAKSSGPIVSRGTVTVARLASDRGGTAAFAIGASFVGFFVFVTIIALFANEFSGGTFRALLLRSPHRMRLMIGKLVATMMVAAVTVALAEVFSFGMSLLLAPGKDISTSPWFSAAGVRGGLVDFATVLAGVGGWAVFGTTLAIIFRSTPLALGVGFAWAGPFENIISQSWSTGLRFFPGQVLGALIRGGTADLGLQRAVVTALAYTAVAATASLMLLTRRDVTS